MPVATPNRAGWWLATAPAHALADYYLAARGSAAVMPRRSFDPAALKALLPRIYLLELHSPQDIRVRLAGTCLVESFGHQLAGLSWLDLIGPEQRRARGITYAGMAGSGYGLRSELRYPASIGETMVIECLSLPLAPEHDEPPRVLGVIASLQRMPGARPLPFLRGDETLTALPLSYAGSSSTA